MPARYALIGALVAELALPESLCQGRAGRQKSCDSLGVVAACQEHLETQGLYYQLLLARACVLLRPAISVGSALPVRMGPIATPVNTRPAATTLPVQTAWQEGKTY